MPVYLSLSSVFTCVPRVLLAEACSARGLYSVTLFKGWEWLVFQPLPHAGGTDDSLLRYFAFFTLIVALAVPPAVSTVTVVLPRGVVAGITA